MCFSNHGFAARPIRLANCPERFHAGAVAISDSSLRPRLALALKKRPEILDAYLFGSAARGVAQPHSDIDVAVFVDLAQRPDSPYGYEAELTSYLMGELKTNAIDVVVLNGAPPLLYYQVLRGGVRLVTRELGATTAREGEALSRYCDYVPQLRKIARVHAERIRGGDFGR
ncbi:MAG: nucleotidyltransferase domain-containing protein [Myxococcales bacterium]|nr:nucleotidyltransferase domain-containing protein [Myxococcales bacterium]